MRFGELVIDTLVCLTLAKWETVSGRFGGYLRNALIAGYSKGLHEVLRFFIGSHTYRAHDNHLIEPIVNKIVPRHGCGAFLTIFSMYFAGSRTSNKNWALSVASAIGGKRIGE